MEPENNELEAGLEDLGPEENAARAFITDDIAHGVGLDVPDPKEALLENEVKEGDEQAPAAGTRDAEGTQPAAEAPAPVEPAAGALGADERAPDTWKPAAAAKWATVDPEVRAEIRRREQNISDFVSQTKPAVDIATRFNEVAQPYYETMRQYNIDPIKHVGSLLYGHYKLIMGSPQEKMSMARQLLQDAGIDPSTLADPEGRPNQMVEQFNQALRARDQQIAGLSTQLGQISTAARAERADKLASEIATFAKDRPHFDRLTESMTQLIRTKAVASLEEAYDVAELRDPVTRAERLGREAAALAAKNAEAAAARTTAARRGAAVNVKSRGSARAATKDETIDDTLKEQMAVINSRH